MTAAAKPKPAPKPPSLRSLFVKAQAAAGGGKIAVSIGEWSGPRPKFAAVAFPTSKAARDMTIAEFKAAGTEAVNLGDFGEAHDKRLQSHIAYGGGDTTEDALIALAAALQEAKAKP
jgi:hypothetical protein